MVMLRGAGLPSTGNEERDEETEMIQLNYPTKKALKESKGKALRYTETSIFGSEFPDSGTGKVTGVGPNAYTKRDWYANVDVEDGVIVKVT